VNGQPLPYTYYQTATEKREWIDDVIVLTNTGTWSTPSPVC
jgi:hypothetical protein